MTIKKLLKNYGIAITGGIATGKSSITRILTGLGYYCIDADKLAREVVQPGTHGHEEIVKAFGTKILATDGSIDRKKLRELVFKNTAKRKILEGITHPEIRKVMERKLEVEGLVQAPRIFFYEAALIFEAGLAHDFREVWLVVTDPEMQYARLQKRDAMSEQQAQEIMSAQMTDEEKEKLADVVIENHGDVEDLSRTLQQVLDALNDRIGHEP
jgi:dephospho-CoA kinase